MVFACGRVVDKATVDEDTPAPGLVLAEAVQLAREDPANVKRLVQSAAKKLTSSAVVTRIKAVRFLTHLFQNGPRAVADEVRLITSTISECISWRGPLHPRRGYEPYQELKEAAQALSDLAFSAAGTGRPAVQAFPVTNAPVPGKPSYGGQMESIGSAGVVTQAPSLDPKNLDPNAREDVRVRAGRFFGGLFGAKETPLQGAAPTPASPWGLPPPVASGPAGVAFSAPPPDEPQVAPQSWQPRAPQSHMARLDQDPAWIPKKTQDMPVAAETSADSPTAKLLKVAGTRAIPTNSELSQYRAGVAPAALPEIRAGLLAPDWKVKLRAVSAVEIYADKFGADAVGDLVPLVTKLIDSPQASLKTSARRVSAALGVQVDE